MEEAAALWGIYDPTVEMVWADRERTLQTYSLIALHGQSVQLKHFVIAACHRM